MSDPVPLPMMPAAPARQPVRIAIYRRAMPRKSRNLERAPTHRHSLAPHHQNPATTVSPLAGKPTVE